MIAGKYQVRPPLPFTPGFEVAGRVESVGPGKKRGHHWKGKGDCAKKLGEGGR
jgi:NADPH:quinone reductase-like Zn-dependent oxidoreductase